MCAYANRDCFSRRLILAVMCERRPAHFHKSTSLSTQKNNKSYSEQCQLTQLLSAREMKFPLAGAGKRQKHTRMQSRSKSQRGRNVSARHCAPSQCCTSHSLNPNARVISQSDVRVAKLSRLSVVVSSYFSSFQRSK